MRAFCGELLGHNFVYRVYKRFRKVSSANAGLIGDDNNGHPGFIQATDRFGDTRQDTKSAGVIQVADFLGNGAVAVEKNGRAERADFRQGSPPLGGSIGAPRIPRRRA